MKGDGDYISHSATAILNHQNCLHLKVRFAFVAYCHLLFDLLFFVVVVDRKWAFLEHNSAEATLCKLFARTSVQYISCEKLLSACFHILMHEYRNPDTAVNAQYVYSTTTPLRVQAIWATLFRNLSPWNQEFLQTSELHVQSYSMFTVLKYAINEILCVSV